MEGSLCAIEDIPRDARPYMVVEQNANRYQRVGGVTLTVPRRTAVVFFLREDGSEYQSVVDLGETSPRAPAVYLLGQSEWAQFLDLQKWREEANRPQAQTFEEMTRQWLQTIIDTQEEAARAYRAVSTFGYGGKLQRE